MSTAYQSIQEAISNLDRHFLAENALGVDTVFQLQFTGEGGGDWYLIVKESALKVVSGVHDNPPVCITVSAEDWLSVINGETKPVNLFMQGRLKLTGDMGLALQFQNLFSRSGTTKDV